MTRTALYKWLKPILNDSDYYADQDTLFDWIANTLLLGIDGVEYDAIIETKLVDDFITSHHVAKEEKRYSGMPTFEECCSYDWF